VRNGGDIVVYSAEGGVPIIFGRDEMPSKLVRLETFWNTIVRIRGTQLLQYVDLRYQDQVVASWKPEPSATKSL
jgi:cell division septal protein FtsQ